VLAQRRQPDRDRRVADRREVHAALQAPPAQRPPAVVVQILEPADEQRPTSGPAPTVRARLVSGTHARSLPAQTHTPNIDGE
jgi:hypothetical protein